VEAGLTQIRVHELASELNVSTQQVLSLLEDLGKKVRGPSTVIGVSAAAKVRGRFRLPKSAPAASTHVAPVTQSVAKSTDHVAAAGTEPSSTIGVGLNGGVDASPSTDQRATMSQSLFLPPVAPTAAAAVTRTTGAFANPFAIPSGTPAPAKPATVSPAARVPVAPMPPRSVVNRVSPIPATVPVAEPQPDYDALWERRGISKADQESWLAGGLRPSEAELADRCQSVGIVPSDLSKKLSGRTAVQRLRDGEASTSVWARIREAEQQPRRAGTKLTGRFQLS
jgi:Translation initiation factor IF-2, N-terminal region